MAQETLKTLGPPGTGKTHRLLELFSGELRVTKPFRIAYLTFTRAARLEALVRTGLTERDLPFVKTIHGVCYSQLQTSQNQIVKTKDVIRFGKEIGVEVRGSLHDPFSLDTGAGGVAEPAVGDRLLQLNHLGRHRQLHLKDTLAYASTDIDFELAKFFTLAYRDWKTREDLVDYTDLLTAYLKFGRPLDVDAIFVDEAQDLSALQWEVVRKLGARAERRYLAGDDDQCIYQWAGASADLFQNETCTQTEVLGQSYRLPRRVQNFALSVIERVRTRLPKAFNPRDSEGFIGDAARITQDIIQPGDTAFVLYRNHVRALELARQMEMAALPYTGAYSPISKYGVRNAISGLHKVWSGQDTLTADEATACSKFSSEKPKKFQSGSSVPWRTVFAHTLLTAREISLWLPLMPFSDYFQTIHSSVGLKALLEPKIELISIHQSKGRQANTVVVDLEMTKRTYDSFLEDPDSEHRVFYVGATRARERLFTIIPSTPSSYPV